MKQKLTLQRLAASAVIALVMMLAGQSVRAAVTITALSGTGGTGGEGYPSLVDGNVKSKMGHSCFRDDVPYAYIIIKTSIPVIPKDYFLVIGNDTKSNPDRNWEDWTIYAANFSSDAEAIEGASDWTVVDERKGELLPSENFAGVDFTFNKADGSTAYQYFMIKITRAYNGATDIWLQMSEFGFGTYTAFQNSAPIIFTALQGTRHNSDGEGLPKLFDGRDDTKWGNGLDISSNWGADGKGAYAIFKSSRPIAPTYYKLVTGTDNAAFNHRNWKEFRIYATAETDESKLTRVSDKWILLDDKNVGEDVLPDKNSFSVYLAPSEENTTEYTYFKLEVASIQSGNGYMQMSELVLGDAAQFAIDRDNIYQKYATAVDLTKAFQSSLKETYQTLLNQLNSASDIFEVSNKSLQLEETIQNINLNINAYASLESMISAMRMHYDSHTCITGDARKIVGDYLNENIAPNALYPNGSYPYILANMLLSTDEINKEVRFAGNLLELYASDMTDGAIEGGLMSLGGTETNSAEGPGFLFDKDSNTKWCTTNNATAYVIFTSDEPIAPTYYKLTTANDTGKNPGRNWKTWKIYGANFDSEEAAGRDAEGWVMIDEKNNIGTDQLPAANFTDAYFNMSNPSSTTYKYFKIEVEALVNGQTMQMADFEFGNDANRILYRNEKYAEFEAFDTEVMAYRSYIDDYKQTLEDLKAAASITEIGSYVTKLKGLQDKINTSVGLYEAYLEIYAQLESSQSNFSDYQAISEWVDDYINKNIEPGVRFLRGTYQYIAENCQLDDNGIKAETIYLTSLLAASEDIETTRFIVLDGRGKWNDNENWAKLVDNNYETKWGCNFSEAEPPYVIFRSLESVNPYFYTLNTGGDTEQYSGRNWKNWKIYGANFEGDGLATLESDGWVLIDEKTEVGQNRLKPTNNTASYFGFSSETTEPYTYYKVVVEKAYSGDAQQMQELHFGTPEEFEVIKEDYKAEANEFNTDVLCEQAILNKYSETVDEIDNIVNMEVLFRTYDEILNLQKSIAASAQSYQNYVDAVEALRTFLEENSNVQGSTRSIIEDYLSDTASEPSDIYPNGSYVYITEERLLNDSLLTEEIAFLENLKKALVTEGYLAGTEITSMVSDPSLAAGGEGWSQTAYSFGTYDGVSAGEFCNEKRIFDINQTLTGLKDGYYEVRINAAFRPAGDTTSTNYSAIVYANDAKIYAPTVIEEMVSKDEAEDGVNCHISGSIPDKVIRDQITLDTLGYVIWGVHGSTVAFNSGRFENVLVAKVTDGQLTFGFKNEGTPDNANGKGDWASMGNTRIFYLGAEENDVVNAAFDRALACQAKRAATIADYVAEDPDIFKHTPNFSQNERAGIAEAAARIETATTVAAKAEIQATFSTLAESINATKKAYVVCHEGSMKVYNKWSVNTLTNFDALTADIYDVQDNLIVYGTYSADEALAAKENLYAKWPDYLKVTNAEDMGFLEEEPFSYTLTSSSSRPYLIAGEFYEPLDSTVCVLKFEYKSDANLTGSRFYFGTPALNTTQVLESDGLSKADDWKTVYFYIAPAISQWSFGDLEDIIRFDLGSEVTDGTTISIRHLQFISQEQMEAESGEMTYPTAIGAVEEQIAPVVKGIFNLSGQRVSRTEKGIYIIDGRKVLVK